MKTCSTLAALSATVTLLSIESVYGYEKYLAQIPNGGGFAQALGHNTADGTYTEFGTAFLSAGATWTTALCETTFPGSDMTNGEAFGDPCCTWKVGGTPDSTVTAFTTTPTKKTECASAATTAPTATTEAPTATTETPTVTTETPTVTTATPASTTVAPSNSTTKPNISKCRVRKDDKKAKDESDSSDDDDDGEDGSY